MSNTVSDKPETVAIRIVAEDKESIVTRNSENTRVKETTKYKRLSITIVGLLVLIPKVYL